MRVNEFGDKKSVAKDTIRSQEATATIPRGAPVCLNLSGTEDGLGVVLPSTGAAIKAHSLFYGICDRDLTPNRRGEANVFGMCDYTKIVKHSRAASTVTWASKAAVAIGQLLQVDTVHNAMKTQASIGASNFLPVAVIGEAIASQASSATATSDTRTVIFDYLKAFLRAL